MLNDDILGWRITCNKDRPVTGIWTATKFGVGLCAGSYEALTTMIRAKEDEMKKPFTWRTP